MGLIKAVRAIGWGIGLVMLFVQPIIGLIILIAALMATIYLARETRERRQHPHEDPPPTD